MGVTKSKNKIEKDKKYNHQFIDNHYQTYDELQQALKDEGLESSQLIVGIDFTKSNLWQGTGVFEYDNLHTISNIINPYQQVLSIMCQSLSTFDDDQMIDAYGFGDKNTSNKSVFPLQIPYVNGNYMEYRCSRLDGVLENYKKVVSQVELSGPTSFVPLIRTAIDHVHSRKSYHILIIITDGCVNDVSETTKAIVDASNYPLSIICIGVGKGPWDEMIKMDDHIPNRKFDNFQFVDYHKLMKKCENEVVEFAKNALMEIPIQYNYIKRYL